MAHLSKEFSYTFDDVLIKPQYSEVRSRDEVDISVELVSGLTLKAPIMPANMQTVNSVELCVEIFRQGGLATVDQFQDISKQVKMLKDVKKQDAKVAGAIGTTKDYIERAEALIKNGVDLIIMDTPHGHNILSKEAIKRFRKTFKDFPVIVGNIATREAAIAMISWGVDGVKVGVGPGAACLTRVHAGAGAPQVTAVMECFEVLRSHNIAIIADGGVKTPGDFATAIAAGGSAVYMGSVFAGTDEAPSEMIEVNGKKFKQYFGSSSALAKVHRAKNHKHFKEKASRYVEGAEGYTKYQGSVRDVVERMIMGLKSAMSYTGAFNVKEFQEKAIFTPITNNGVIENGAHGLV